MRPSGYLEMVSTWSAHVKKTALAGQDPKSTNNCNPLQQPNALEASSTCRDYQEPLRGHDPERCSQRDVDNAVGTYTTPTRRSLKPIRPTSNSSKRCSHLKKSTLHSMALSPRVIQILAI
jgi:hypothetical protein